MILRAKSPSLLCLDFMIALRVTSSSIWPGLLSGISIFRYCFGVRLPIALRMQCSGHFLRGKGSNGAGNKNHDNGAVQNVIVQQPDRVAIALVTKNNIVSD